MKIWINYRLLIMFMIFGEIMFFHTQQATAAVYLPPSIDKMKIELNGEWKFAGSNTLTGAAEKNYDDSSWKSVTIPHSWNNKSNPTLYSNAWYRTSFSVSKADLGKKIYLYFEGAGIVADVYVNGVHIGQHKGSFTHFIFDATSNISFGQTNTLAVKLNNNTSPDGLPSTDFKQLYNLYGGIYRKVWLIKTNKFHIDPTDYSTSGVYVSQSNVSSGCVRVTIKTMVRNDGEISSMFTVRNIICDSQDNIVCTLTGNVTVGANSKDRKILSGNILSPKLWNVGNPYLYNVYTEVWVHGLCKDMVKERIGFRYFQLSPTNFTLNGKALQLRGVSKHQESENSGNAVSQSDLTADFDNIEDLGANCIRLAHYPHADYEYNLADERGIIIWAENGHSNKVSGTTAGDYITKEMVYQNFNHPSILFWSCGNEANKAAASRYAGIIKECDTQRPVVYADDSEAKTFSNVDFIFRNKYHGWYKGAPGDFENYAAKNHYISESGAGGVITNHQSYSSRNFTIDKFEPEEYMQIMNEVRYQTVFRNKVDDVPAFFLWLFKDISVWGEKYKSVNTKGLLTYSNLKKDSYYHFKSFLRPDTPVIHICSPYWNLRIDVADIKVYSNCTSLKLTVNGASKGSKSNGDYRQPMFNNAANEQSPSGTSLLDALLNRVSREASGSVLIQLDGKSKQQLNTVINNTFFWPDVLVPGRNKISVTDGCGNIDTVVIYYTGRASSLPNENGAIVQNLVSSNSGNPAYFVDVPVKDQWPIYYEVDGNSDNTFDVVPKILTGARAILTKRQSNSSYTTSLSFGINRNVRSADVFVMFTDANKAGSFLSAEGFNDTGVSGKWRDHNLDLVRYRLYKKTFPGGAKVHVRGVAADFVVLTK
ncbi:MAG: beta galactosidase jelly roll domain-containing protein [Candidatus Riflebacteria bacterium]|nr:beta galactosidase jelly roll domain-containing protein [Candidatus Riflebacteria bacterium]